jgi:hypothetical protein
LPERLAQCALGPQQASLGANQPGGWRVQHLPELPIRFLSSRLAHFSPLRNSRNHRMGSKCPLRWSQRSFGVFCTPVPANSTVMRTMGEGCAKGTLLPALGRQTRKTWR